MSNEKEKSSPKTKEIGANDNKTNSQNDVVETQEQNQAQEDLISISKSEFEKLKQERDEFLENWKRERADKINFKNQVEKRVKDQLNREGSRVLTKLLNIVDNFSRALEKSSDQLPEAHLEGFRLVYEELLQLLKQEGVEEIPIETGVTSFNPVYHEALYTIESSEYPENTIAEVVFRGFMRNGLVMRPAKVAVYKAKSAPIEEPQVQE